jgi:phage baseplate assembly protein gpV
MSDAISLIQAIIRDQLQAFKTAELGVVTNIYSHEQSSDKNNYECDVRLRNSGLELKRLPVATLRIGVVAIPNKDDLVLVQYLHGDIHSAVITGRLYNDMDRPPEAKPHEFVYETQDKPESGIRRLCLKFPNGNSLLLDDDKLTLEMGKTTVTITHDGDVAMSSEAKLTIQTKGDASLNVNGNLELKAKGDVKLSGVNVSIQAQSNVSVEGMAGATVKAASIKLAGKTDFSLA